MTQMTNARMAYLIELCERYVDYKGKLGYACARNMRMLTNASQEFLATKNKLIERYGEVELDDQGDETGRVKINTDSQHWDDFVAEIEPLETIEHSVEIMKVEADEVIEQLTGREIMALGWMIEDWED